MFIDPLVLNSLLKATEAGLAISQGFAYVLVLSVSMIVRVSAMEVCYFNSLRAMNNVRSCLAVGIYRKAVNLGHNSRQWTTGGLTNLLATDNNKFGKDAWIVFFLAQWTFAVCSLPAVVFFLYRLVGSAAFVGTAAILIGNQVNVRVAKAIKPFVHKVQKQRDARGRLVSELTRNIRMVKLQGWEESWRTRLLEARELEMRALKTVRYLNAFNVLIGGIVSICIPVSIFATYTLAQKQVLTGPIAFTTLAWIGQMQWSITTIPSLYNLLAYGQPSVERIFVFLNSPGPGNWLALDEKIGIGTGSGLVTSEDAQAIRVIGAELGYLTSGAEDDYMGEEEKKREKKEEDKKKKEKKEEEEDLEEEELEETGKKEEEERRRTT
eukprot:gb/GEZN01006593.1/.p1 GENE.gb/GEZN01006593.1/~~gb/GEZN01006593.1/.p1  ORF type:complete len:435 (-),score=101.02 gb/GEZN01006593.1/:338-1477(-)